MTREEKLAYLQQLIQEDGNLRKLMLFVITNALTIQPDEKLDLMISILSPPADPPA